MSRRTLVLTVGIALVAAAETSSFEKAKPTLQAMLESFKFGRPASAPPAPPKPDISFALFQDPVEGAFSVRIPKDWQAQGGTNRRAATDLVHHVLVVSPDQKSWVQFNDPSTPLFVLPTQPLAWAGYPEGTMYSPGYGVSGLVSRYLPGETFLKQYLLRNLAPKVGKFEIVNLKDQPDAVAEFNRIYSEFMNMGVQLTLHAGEAAFRYERNGEPFVGYGTALTQVAYMPSMQGGNWMVPVLAIYTCPEREAPNIQDLASRMFQSFQMNPVWVARQQQTNANVGRIVAETGREISRIISDAYWTRQGVMDNVHRKFSNAILGVTDVRDPETGETWKVEAGHNFYWAKGAGRGVAGTDTYTRPDINFRPLFEIK